MNLPIVIPIAVSQAITRAEREKARRSALILAGICIHCRRAPATTEGGLCGQCRELHATRAWLAYTPKGKRYGRRVLTTHR